MNITNIAFNADSTITVTNADASLTVFSSSTSTPVVTPEDVEIDVVLSDGTTKKFVPAPVVTA